MKDSSHIILFFCGNGMRWLKYGRVRIVCYKPFFVSPNPSCVLAQSFVEVLFQKSSLKGVTGHFYGKRWAVQERTYFPSYLSTVQLQNVRHLAPRNKVGAQSSFLFQNKTRLRISSFHSNLHCSRTLATSHERHTTLVCVTFRCKGRSHLAPGQS